MSWFHTLHPEWHRNAPLMAFYYTVLMGLAAALVAIAPWFGLFAIAVAGRGGAPAWYLHGLFG